MLKIGNIGFRLFFGIWGFLLVFIGMVHFLKGETDYQNFWGGLVFSPIAIIVGLILIYIIIFRWQSFLQTPGNKSKSKKR